MYTQVSSTYKMYYIFVETSKRKKKNKPTEEFGSETLGFST